MYDLISREAAIDAHKRAAYWQDGERKIAGLPAIDAIPVEWLQNEAKRQHDMGEWADADVIYWLIQTWQKEQEDI